MALAALLALLAVACGAAPLSDPAIASAERAPTVIVVSLDGVHPAYLERGALPGLQRMTRQGARAEALIPVFPASTFPNHVSLATGTHPDRHGIVSNRFTDATRGEFDYDNDASWIEAEPLWAAAERQGVRAAVYFWVGSETAWRGRAATWRRTPFASRIQERQKVEQILAWIDLPDPPRLVMSWWHGADRAGHLRGPGSHAVDEAMAEQDAELSHLLAGLDARAAWPHTTLLVVSDHGMAEVERVVDARALLRDAGIRARVLQSGGTAHVHLEDASRGRDAVRALRDTEGVQAWVVDDLPPALRHARADRVGQVVALTEPPQRFGAGRAARRDRGAHGYDPSRPEMQAILAALGRNVPRGARLGRPRAIDVAPTVARLLDIDPPEHNEGTAIPQLASPKGAQPR